MFIMYSSGTTGAPKCMVQLLAYTNRDVTGVYLPGSCVSGNINKTPGGTRAAGEPHSG